MVSPSWHLLSPAVVAAIWICNIIMVLPRIGYPQLFYVSMSCPQGPILILVDPLGYSASCLRMNYEWLALPIRHLDSVGHQHLPDIGRMFLAKGYSH
jgi:hypothetical protein